MQSTQTASLKQMSKGMTLLYIEDDALARDAANSLFSEFFDTVIVGFDGEDGARLYATHHKQIDLVITDKAVFDVDKEKQELVLIELMPDVTLEEIQASTAAKYRVALK